MEQEKIEDEAQELFKRQGFTIEDVENGYRAEKEYQELRFQVFSSEKFSVEEAREHISEEVDTIFVDEDLRELKKAVSNEVSVLREESQGTDYDLPSFELIGDIAVINDLDGRDEEKVIEGIGENHPHVETILLKEEQLSGEFRVGKYRKLYGDKTETIHKEFGVEIKVDPTKAYYSERFSTERKRVADQIKPGEKALVMFAGVGPFALVATRRSEAEKIVAVEKNPEACRYLEENIEMNNFEDNIESQCGDVRDILPELEDKFDRIIMPLPGEADEFLDLAESKAADNATIHYYRFREEGTEENLKKEIDDIMDREFKIREIVKCGEKSPSTDRVCIDIVTDK